MTAVAVIGSFVQDLAFFTAQLPAAGETRIGTFRTGPGGKGFNQAVACHRQEIATLFIGAIGGDLFAQSVIDFSANEKLPLALERHPQEATGTAAILVDAAGRNSIVVALGANGSLSSGWIDQHAASLHAARVVLTQAESNLAAATRALTIGRESGAVTILNPAPINRDVTVELLSRAQILTPNETELAFLATHLLGASSAPAVLTLSNDELHALCRALPSEVVIVTLGERGSFVSVDGRSPLAQSLGGARYQAIRAFEVSAIDTTGAGDAFSGGLAAGLMRYDRDLVRAATYASAVAALSTEKAGTAPSMPHAAEVRKRFSL